MFICVFLAALGLRSCMAFLSLQRAGAALPLQCMGFSWWKFFLLWSVGPRVPRPQSLRHVSSVVVTHRLDSPGSWAWLLCGVWGLPGPGIEHMSPHRQVASLPLSLRGSLRGRALTQLFCSAPGGMSPLPTSTLSLYLPRLLPPPLATHWAGLELSLSSVRLPMSITGPEQ